MSHPYTDHYPSGPDINQRLSDHEKRIKELETKLGAAEAGLSTDREAVEERPITTSSPTAAPSVSAAYWRHSAERTESIVNGWAGNDRIPAAFSVDDAKRLATAYRLAAAVTEWREPIAWEKYSLGQAEDLIRIVIAFVRGEPLPQRGK